MKIVTTEKTYDSDNFASIGIVSKLMQGKLLLIGTGKDGKSYEIVEYALNPENLQLLTSILHEINSLQLQDPNAAYTIENH